MLKITSVKQGPSDLLLIVEGRVLGPWIEALDAAAAAAAASALGRVSIDLSEVSFVDEEGVRLLQRLLEQGIGLQAASPFVHALLHGNR